MFGAVRRFRHANGFLRDRHRFGVFSLPVKLVGSCLELNPAILLRRGRQCAAEYQAQEKRDAAAISTRRHVSASANGNRVGEENPEATNWNRTRPFRLKPRVSLLSPRIVRQTLCQSTPLPVATRFPPGLETIADSFRATSAPSRVSL